MINNGAMLQPAEGPANSGPLEAGERQAGDGLANCSHQGSLSTVHGYVTTSKSNCWIPP